MAEDLSRHLEFLYRSEEADRLRARIDLLVETHRSSLPARPVAEERTRLGQRDAILITYADQVQEGSVSPLASLAQFLEHYVRETVTGVHLLPFYPSSSDDGFAVVDYCRVDPAFGDWSDIARLGQSFDLMFDAVFNHLSAQSPWFRAFLQDAPDRRGFFISVEGEPDLSSVVRPRTSPLWTEFVSVHGPVRVWTTFSADQVDLNFANPDVLLAVIEVLLFYVARGARFIRLDAVAFLWKQIGTSCLHLPQTHRIIKILRTVLDRAAPHVLLITETNVPHADNVLYFGNGRDEAQLVYNFALPPLVLHSLTTGNADQLTQWARALSVPSDEVTFFNFLASHDGIGLNPARGILSEREIQALVDRTLSHGGFVSEKALPNGSRAPYELNINYFDALSNPRGVEPASVQVARFLCAHALMLSLPGVPGVYFHSLFGSRGDPAGAEASGIPRRINRQKLSRTVLEKDLADPSSLRALVFGGLQRLLIVRRNHGAFQPGAAAEVLGLDPRVFAIRRAEEEGPLLCLHNVSGDTVELDLSSALAGSRHVWRPLFQTVPGNTRQGSNAVGLPPYGVWWGRPESV